MKRFEIGEKVVALTDPPNSNCQKRKKGCIYTVTSMMFCTVRGHQFINIDDQKTIAYLVSCNCGTDHEKPDDRAYTYSKHFARLSDLEREEKEAVENEDYETAAILRDITKKI